jgi:flagellar biosynthetic protein FliQ
MTSGEALELTQAALWASFVASSPVIIAVMVVGVVISVLQALTQIQEITLTFVPKIIVAMLMLALSGPYIGATILKFTERTYARIEATTLESDR